MKGLLVRAATGLLQVEERNPGRVEARKKVESDHLAVEGHGPIEILDLLCDLTKPVQRHLRQSRDHAKPGATQKATDHVSSARPPAHSLSGLQRVEAEPHGRTSFKSRTSGRPPESVPGALRSEAVGRSIAESRLWSSRSAPTFGVCCLSRSSSGSGRTGISSCRGVLPEPMVIDLDAEVDALVAAAPPPPDKVGFHHYFEDPARLPVASRALRDGGVLALAGELVAPLRSTSPSTTSRSQPASTAGTTNPAADTSMATASRGRQSR